MNRLRLVVASLAMLACSAAHAAAIYVEESSANPGAFAIYLDGQSHNGNFNVVDFKVSPVAPATFQNVNSGLSAGVPRPPGQAFTYYNQLLNSDPVDFPGGLNWSLLGVVRTSTQVAFAGSPLGQQISTTGQPGGKLFLANIYMPTGMAHGTVQLIDAGLLRQQIDFAFPIPEPAILGLSGFAMLVGLIRSNFRR